MACVKKVCNAKIKSEKSLGDTLQNDVQKMNELENHSPELSKLLVIPEIDLELGESMMVKEKIP